MSKFKHGDIVTNEHYAKQGVTYVYDRFDNSHHSPHRVRFNDAAGGEDGFLEAAGLYLVETTSEESNATSPNVYKFPNAEVRDISAHLTSYGGQVVQYVARATRLDGVFKEDKVQDLEKAKLMIQWEIERLQPLTEDSK